MKIDEPIWLSQLSFERLDSGHTIESLEPAWDGEANECPNLEMLISKICDEHAVRKARSRSTAIGHGKDEARLPVSLNLWLKPICYNIILSYENADMHGVLDRRIGNHGRHSRGTPKNLSIFQIGLMALFAHREARSILDVRERDRMSRQMWYAFRHYIPPALINGFNCQFPENSRASKSEQPELEPSMISWVVEQRSIWFDMPGELEELRGKYPDEIIKKFEYILSKRRIINSKANYNDIELDDDW